jgi:hypothetical protein
MPFEHPSDVKFEIGHVLFIDIVGYSKLLINEQSEQIQKLNQIVSATKQFRLAEAEDKLLRLPTGDGGALIFRTSPEAPALCALDTARRALRELLAQKPDFATSAREDFAKWLAQGATRACA